MSNIVAALTQSAPAIFTREQVKQEIAGLKADAIHALSSVSTAAARESFIKTCCAIAVQRAVFGQDEIYRAISDKARKLPEYRTNKAGLVTGKLGAMLQGFGDAVAVGKVLADKFDRASNEIDLSVLLGSPTFGGLIAAPKKAAPPTPEELAKAEKIKAEKAETAKKIAAMEAEAKKAIEPEKVEITDEEKAETIKAKKADSEISKLAEKLAASEVDGPVFLSAFTAIKDFDEGAARAMLAEMAALLGMDVIPHKARKTAKA